MFIKIIFFMFFIIFITLLIFAFSCFVYSEDFFSQFFAFCFNFAILKGLFMLEEMACEI